MKENKTVFNEIAKESKRQNNKWNALNLQKEPFRYDFLRVNICFRFSTRTENAKALTFLTGGWETLIKGATHRHHLVTTICHMNHTACHSRSSCHYVICLVCSVFLYSHHKLLQNANCLATTRAESQGFFFQRNVTLMFYFKISPTAWPFLCLL